MLSGLVYERAPDGADRARRDFAAYLRALMRGDIRAAHQTVAQAPEEARARWRAGAAAGEPHALWLLAYCHDAGLGVATDKPVAERLYAAAAERAFPAAWWMLALARENAGDLTGARDLLRPAVAAAFPPAMAAFGSLLVENPRTGEDTAAGLTLLARAADLGHAHAAEELAFAYLHGTAVPQDLQRVRHWARRGSACGSHICTYLLNDLA
jgi:TPR repeat protein